MTKIFFSEQGGQKYQGGDLTPLWSFTNPYGPLESLKCLLFGKCMRARRSDTGLERSDRCGSEVGQKMAKKCFSGLGCQKYRGGNLTPPWSLANPFVPLESLQCLLFGTYGRARTSATGSERSDHHGLEVGARLEGVQLTFNMAN